MFNSTRYSYFILGAFFDTGHLKYVFFGIVMCLYFLTICANLLLIVVICTNKSLHEPMYLFLCSLLVNELYGSTALFPVLLLHILSDLHTISVSCCFLQIFCVYTYASIQFSSLTVMCYDRYLAICCPLQYHTRMTSHKVTMLIGISWLYPVVAISALISLSAPLPMCGNMINKVYCDNYSIVKQACSDTTVNNLYGMVYTLTTVFLVLLIVYSYIKILRVCFSGSRQTRQKAVSTCTPHLASILNFSCGCFFEIIQNRFDLKYVPNVARILLSLYWLACQPLFNPLMYGLNLRKIRLTCKSVLLGKV